MAIAIRSKWYSQQYNQDKPVSIYIISNTYAKTRDLSEKPDVQKVDVER